MKTFTEIFDFPNNVKKQYGEDIRYKAELTGDTYKSGREIYEFRFYNELGVHLATHEGMQLESKKTGKPYFVCKREKNKRTDFKTVPEYSLEDLKQQANDLEKRFKTHGMKWADIIDDDDDDNDVEETCDENRQTGHYLHGDEK